MVSIPPHDHRSAREIERQLGLPPLAARILAGRGLTDVEEVRRFLYPRITDLSDPFLLPQAREGAARLLDAVNRGEQICLYGDYDADGVTSLALMINFLKHLGAEAATYIPERQEGYGLNREAIRSIAAAGTRLLVSLDCGSTSAEEIALAREAGMETVVIDHHEVGDSLPAAKAIINPKRRDSVFPTRDLAACGVTFFFLQGLRRILYQRGLMTEAMNLRQELDMVALGTIGDMVPLTGDNRILVRFGLDTMRRRPRTWLNSFLKKRLLSERRIDETGLSFIVAPRINAAGRVSKPHAALKFLTCVDEALSEDLLMDLHGINRRRQRIEEETLNEIADLLKGGGHADRRTLVVFKEGWHVGVIGIVAQKLMETYGKPAIVMTKVGEVWKGSGRGGGGLDLHGTISSIAPLLKRFGGHRFACGVTVEEEKLEAFSAAFEEAVAANFVGGPQPIRADAAAEFDELTEALLTVLEDLAPYGVGNPRPTLLLRPRHISVQHRRVKMVDGANRTWHGFIQGRKMIPSFPEGYVVASPVREEGSGCSFISLSVKEIVPVTS